MARIYDDVELSVVFAGPRYPGGPNKLSLPGVLDEAKRLLLMRWNCDMVAAEVGYATHRGFSDAFLQLVGERPGAWAKRHGIKAMNRRRPGAPCLKPRKRPDRSGQTPLLSYAAAARRRAAAVERARKKRRKTARPPRLRPKSQETATAAQPDHI